LIRFFLVNILSDSCLKRLPLWILILFFRNSGSANPALPASDSILQTAVITDPIKPVEADTVDSYVAINKLGHKKFHPVCDLQTKKMVLRNQKARFGRKFIRGAGLIISMQSFSYGLLFAVPESVSNWDHDKIHMYGQNMIDAFSKPPVVDGDHWYINYLGHPFQGSYYYNAYRSQGAPFWQCALLSIGHSGFWEYIVESGIERPSVQDLVVTPIVGSFIGEFFHFATKRMARNGFKWYEAATVCIINPMFALNNGFKFAVKKKEY
jgi:Domain of unknown function (DUF3943)